MLFDKLDTAKMHGFNTSNVSSRVVSIRDEHETSGIWAYYESLLSLSAHMESHSDLCLFRTGPTFLPHPVHTQIKNRNTR